MTQEPQTFDEVLAQEEPGFRRAVRAVITADTGELSTLLADRPELAWARSASHHKATLLHYVAANGVETPLQVAPGTVYQFLAGCSEVERGPAVERALNVPKVLIEAGGEVDALCRTYGGGPHQTTLNLVVSSAHPHAAGLQSTLATILVRAGAAVDGVENDQSPLLTALAFGYWKTATALVENGARTDGLVVAAAAGRLDQVESFFPEGRLGTDLGSTTVEWFNMSEEPVRIAEQALVYASMCGRLEVVDFLLDRGVDIDAIPPGSHVTAGALHTAALAGQREVVRRLLERGADPERTEPRYGGDPLSWAEHGGDEAVIRLLADAKNA